MRTREIAELQGRRFDLVIIGGGIAGCGIARDATLRGLSVLLVEKDDLASGTSSASSKLAHGGLRYLEYLRFHLVHESLHERETLLRIAPHLVRPLPFLLPIYRDLSRPRWKLRAGLTLYDLLSGRMSLGRHRMLDAARMIEEEPHLQQNGLLGGFRFHDAQMNDARLVLENALDAREHGATILTRVECRDLIIENQRVTGVVLHDRLHDEEARVGAHMVVNAAGPWTARILKMQKLSSVSRPRLSRGTHIVVPALTQGHGILLQARQDRRIFFVLPWKGQSLVGTTEVEHTTSPDEIAPTAEEIEYLLRELGTFFPQPKGQRFEILSSFAGARTLPAGSDRDLGEVSREAEVREEAPGLLCVLGGKFTTYRRVAETAVDRAALLLGRRDLSACATARLALPGGEIADMNDYFQMAENLLVKETGLPMETLRYLLGTYGSRHTKLLQMIRENPQWAEPLEDGLPFTRAEVIHAVRHEFAQTLDDLLWRRTWRAYLGPLDDAAAARWQEAIDEGMRGKAREVLV